MQINIYICLPTLVRAVWLEFGTLLRGNSPKTYTLSADQGYQHQDMETTTISYMYAFIVDFSNGSKW